jgi:hypothetical protein
MMDRFSMVYWCCMVNWFSMVYWLNYSFMRNFMVFYSMHWDWKNLFVMNRLMMSSFMMDRFVMLWLMVHNLVLDRIIVERLMVMYFMINRNIVIKFFVMRIVILLLYMNWHREGWHVVRFFPDVIIIVVDWFMMVMEIMICLTFGNSFMIRKRWF